MPSRPDADRLALLRLARSAVVEAVVNRRQLADIPANTAFAERRGVFVTLHSTGRLRGCIGILEGKEPLGELIARCAASAALEDPRFSPVNAEELPSLRIELSILSPLAPLRPEDLVIGQHGIVIVNEARKGVLLPQVAVEHRLSAEQFLAETCGKAGLPQEAWRDRKTQIFGFTTEILAEE